jgi:hypothetical protein
LISFTICEVFITHTTALKKVQQCAAEQRSGYKAQIGTEPWVPYKIYARKYPESWRGISKAKEVSHEKRQAQQRAEE